MLMQHVWNIPGLSFLLEFALINSRWFCWADQLGAAEDGGAVPELLWSLVSP